MASDLLEARLSQCRQALELQWGQRRQGLRLFYADTGLSEEAYRLYILEATLLAIYEV